ncbi:conjugal transfer protein TrbC [Verminephrobacter aporrectodeae subsp. tuberculatae]|uniref:TrbC/VirB2 family protein n=1 Tax=Verminephrobacter aporrectodeae TaxID=1110389 RepID=UPI002244CCF2|nr:TrbC/VirB2 family protein [Verminephrobacter aporrectodeae]MCW8176322.1 conjugal transfer protein TrbC [Verminephrobacter aporrectodeae subsp. tuberculatae]MCW8204001.1 conjugal transfer protein TrbC [Verminephrobacter aporrectodeae subsp. tuberculatae]
MTTATTSACSPASPSFLATPYFWLAVLALLLLLGTIDPVHAATATESSGGQGLPWEEPLAKLRQSISGPVAFAIALLGIIACGASLIWGGEISDFVRRIVYVVLVVCLIVFSNAMLSTMFSSGAAVSASAHISMADLTACAQAKAGGAAAASVEGAGSH